DSGTSYLKFTVGGFRTEYSSSRPRYLEVLAAVRSGQPVRAWVSTKQETLFPRKGWVRLYKLSTADGEVRDYDTGVADKAGGSRPVLILGCVLLAIGCIGLGACVRQQVRYGRLGPGPVPDLTEAQREEQRRRTIRNATILVSLLFYALIIGVNFEPEV